MPTLINEGPEKCMSCGARYDLESDLDAALARVDEASAERDSYRQANESVRVCREHTDEVTATEPGCLVCERDAALARVKELEADDTCKAMDEVVEYHQTKQGEYMIRCEEQAARIAELEGALQSTERILHAIRTNPALTHLHEWAEGASKQARAALEKK